MVTILKAKKIYKSLGVRVFVILVIVSILPVSLIRIWLLNDYEDTLCSRREVKLQSQCLMLKNTIASSDYITTKNSNFVESELSQLTSMFDGRVLIVNGNYKIIKDTYYVSEGKTTVSENIVKAINGGRTVKKNRDKQYIEITMPVTGQDGKSITAVICAVFSISDIYDAVDKMKTRSLIMLLILYVIICGLGAGFAYLVVHPMKKMQKAIDDIANGLSNTGISEDGYTYTELAGIAKAFNHNVNRSNELDRSRQEFVSNVAHELKTPIASIKVLADSLLNQEDIPVEIYKEFLGDIVVEIDRESEIISDLLSLVHLDNGIIEIDAKPHNINEVLELILKRLRPIAAKRNIELVFESFRPVVADIDEVKFIMAVQNLVENAIKYNVLDGWVRVSLNADHKYFFIKVSDSGIGIPEEDLPKIFERFYRVDKARARETGGTGLGLSIAYKIINLHNGEIKVYSREGEGTTFNVRIPLNYKKRK